MFPPITQLEIQTVSTNTNLNDAQLHCGASYTLCQPEQSTQIQYEPQFQRQNHMHMRHAESEPPRMDALLYKVSNS